MIRLTSDRLELSFNDLEMVRTPWPILAVLALLAATAAADDVASVTPEGAAPVNGFPNWEERVLHQWINRARVDPATDLQDCGANCSDAELAPGCYTPVPPLMWDHEIGVAARFHAASMARQNFFSHSTPCALRSDLAEVYPSSCDGSAACSCSGAGSTSASGRVSLFGASYAGEIIAAGYGDPVSAFYGWLHEPVSNTAPCAFSSGGGGTNGHRWLILKSSGSLGSGYGEGGSWGRYYTTDFGSGGAVYPIPSGVHYPRQAPTVEFRANWYAAEAPSAASVVVDEVAHPMGLERGTGTSGAWLALVSGLGSGCHRYYFEFSDASGQPVRHPTSGTFGVGPRTSCAEWQAADVAAPALAATASSSSSVSVSWTSSPGASQYLLERSAGDLPFAPLSTLGGTSYADITVAPGVTYVYRVRAVEGTEWSNVDHATTIMFADEPLVPNVTVIRATHIAQLRAAVNAVRDAAGLAPRSWTSSASRGVPVRANDIIELRTSLSEALAVLGKGAVFTNTVVAGAPVRAADIQELRNASK